MPGQGRRPPANIIVDDCIVCNKSFVNRFASTKKVCSPVCQLELRRRNHRRHCEKHPKFKTYTCVICGASFVKNRKNSSSITCSEECSNINKRQKSLQRTTKPPKKATCVTCNKQFETFRLPRKFCSKACRQHYRRPQEKEPEYAECVVCKSEFIKGHKRIVCSAECRKARNIQTVKQRRRPAKIRICAICNCEYEVLWRRGSSKTCSLKCSETLWFRRQQAKGKFVTHVCPWCGNTFIRIGSAGRAKACSPYCREKCGVIEEKRRDKFRLNVHERMIALIKEMFGTNYEQSRVIARELRKSTNLVDNLLTGDQDV